MGVGRRSAWLGLAQIIEIGLQVLLPVLLVRQLTVLDFANYRLIWLVANTAATVLPFAVPNALSLILPPATPSDRRAHVALTLIFILGCGVFGGVLTAAGLWWGAGQGGLDGLLIQSSVFVGLWVAGTSLDQLPVADERGDWQAKATITLACLRALAAGGMALWWNDLSPVLWALALVAGARVALLLYYAQSRHAVASARITRAHWKRQFNVAAPLGLAALLFGLRRQGDMWIAAVLFSVQQFAAFSLGTVLSPLVFMVRRAISATLLPAMARQHGQGNWPLVIDTNHRANLAVACIAVPALCFVWAFGEPLYALVYTDAFPQAVPVMRVLALGWLVQVLEFNSLVMLASQMPFVARMNAWLLGFSILTALGGGLAFGLPGVATGSVLAIFVERTLIVRRLSQVLSVPVSDVQPWHVLIRILALSALLAAAGRVAHDQLARGGYSLALWVIPPLLLGVYIALVRRFQWWPRKLIATEE